MDSSDPDIQFSDDGVCNYCEVFLERLTNETTAGNPAMRLEEVVERIGQTGKGRRYDCVIGVSGGVDSTYVAWLLKQHGLRPLAVHFDNGWNSELAVSNIRLALEKLDIDLVTHVVDWKEFRDLQKAFVRASVPNIEIPTDHAINALLHRYANKFRCKYIVTGGNIRTEGIYPKSWGWYNLDLRHLKDVHRRFSETRLKTLPMISLPGFFMSSVLRGTKTVPILNYIDYAKPDAMQVLVDQLGWRPYAGKHFESVFTRFFQGYILPRKFGVDKRRGHFSCLVAGGDMNRDAALAELEQPPYPPESQEEDREYFIKKMEMTETDFQEMLAAPLRQHTDYATNQWFFDGMPQIMGIARRYAKRL